MTKSELNSRYKRACKRVRKETVAIERARDRKFYWQKVKRNLEERLKLANEGQLEMRLE